MCHPIPQTIIPPADKKFGFDRRLPTAWFLADVLIGFDHKAIPAGSHVYVSRTEDGWYRVLRKGVAFLASEGVAARHLRRVKGEDGLAVRVGQQARWSDLWNENYSESRRQTAA